MALKHHLSSSTQQLPEVFHRTKRLFGGHGRMVCIHFFRFFLKGIIGSFLKGFHS
jgi:hypothetical protein